MVYFVWYILSGTFCLVNFVRVYFVPVCFVPERFVRFILSRIFCPIYFVRYILSSIFCSSTFCRFILSSMFCPGMFCPVYFVRVYFVRVFFVQVSFVLAPALSAAGGFHQTGDVSGRNLNASVNDCRFQIKVFLVSGKQFLCICRHFD